MKAPKAFKRLRKISVSKKHRYEPVRTLPGDGAWRSSLVFPCFRRQPQTPYAVLCDGREYRRFVRNVGRRRVQNIRTHQRPRKLFIPPPRGHYSATYIPFFTDCNARFKMPSTVTSSGNVSRTFSVNASACFGA